MILGSVVLLISLTSGDLEEHVQRPGTSFQGMVQQSQVALAARAVLAMPMDVTVITLWPASLHDKTDIMIQISPDL